MTSSPSETIAKAMEGDSIERIAQNFHSDGDSHTVSWSKQKSSYRGAVRKAVRTMIEAMHAAGFEVVPRREFNALALQLEAMKREMAEKDERIAALEAGLKPFGDIADVFDFPGGNRPTQGIIAAWSDHRIGEREFTVESVRRARTLILGEKQ